MTEMTRRVALTGATGFVGARVLDRLLEDGWQVTALARRDQPARDGVTWVSGHLTDDAALIDLTRDADAVVHVAGLIKARNRTDYFEINKTGTARLLAALGGRRIRYIHLSSLAAREPTLSGYAASKAAAETLVRASAQDWTIIRPPAVYGPGDRETLVFFKAAMSCRPFLPGGPKHRTSLIHVADLASAVAASLTLTGLGGKTVEAHDGAPEGYGFAEVLGLIAGSPGWHRPIFVPSPALQAVGAAILLTSKTRGSVPMLTPGKARELTHSDWVCRDTALADAGWQAEIPAARGLPETRAWYEDHGDLP